MSLPHCECTASAAAAHLRVVDDVVVDQRRGVDELDDRRVQHRALALVAAEPRRHQQHGRADALAAARLDVFADARESGRPATAGGGRTRARPSRDRRESARKGAADRPTVPSGRFGSKLVNLTIGSRGVSTRRRLRHRANSPRKFAVICASIASAFDAPDTGQRFDDARAPTRARFACRDAARARETGCRFRRAGDRRARWRRPRGCCRPSGT